MTRGAFTLITSTRPAQLGKCYRLGDGGKLEKTTAGELSAATFEVVEFSGVTELAAILSAVRTDQALMASLPVAVAGVTSNRITTKAGLAADPVARARIKEHWEFPAGRAGVCILDWDVPASGVVTSRDALWSLLMNVAPTLAGAGVLWWCSGSSFIFDGERELQGLRGQRFYLLLADLGDTERLGAVLMKRLALAGELRIEVSASGAKLPRYTFDEALFQRARLSFEGGSVCGASLNQRRGSPLVLSDGGWWDSRAGLPDLTDTEEAQFQSVLQAAKDKAEPEAMLARERWKLERHGSAMATLVRAGVLPGEASERATRTLESALRGVLHGDFEVTTAQGVTLTVGELLDDRQRYHGVELLDPLEPGRRGGAACAKFFAWGAIPTIHSFGRGGSTFKLLRQPARMYVVKGGTSELASELLAFVERQPDLFLRGGALAAVNGGEARTLDRHALAHTLGTRCAFAVKGKERDSACDVPPPAIDQLLSLIPLMKTRELKALALLPFARPDGTLVTAPGFDEQTGVFLHYDAEALQPIPDKPTATDIAEALRQVWRPYEAYPWASEHDRAGALAGLFTAVLRPAMEIAPGFLYDAPTQASGKSRAAGVCGALVRGTRGGATPFVSGAGAEAEMAKKLVSILRGGGSYFLLDNVCGRMASPVLSAVITDGSLEDRVLGSSLWFKGPARLFIALTANAASIDADLMTRLVMVRIDPRCERPQAREFAFDPVERALSERLEIARAVLVLLRAHQVAGAPAPLKGGTRFEAWAGLVRQPIGWLQQAGHAEAAGVGVLGDAAHSLLAAAFTGDPEVEALGDLLRGVDLQFKGEPFKARDLLPLVERGVRATDEAASLVREAVGELLGLANLSAKRLGHALRNRRDRIVGGLVLRAHPSRDRAGTQAWVVAKA